MNIAIVSAHIWLDDNGRKNIEILSQVDNDDNYTDIFDDVDHALLIQIEPNFEQSKSYFFMAIVKSEFVKWQSLDGDEYDVEHAVTEIKSIAKLVKEVKEDE